MVFRRRQAVEACDQNSVVAVLRVTRVAGLIPADRAELALYWAPAETLPRRVVGVPVLGVCSIESMTSLELSISEPSRMRLLSAPA